MLFFCYITVNLNCNKDIDNNNYFTSSFEVNCTAKTVAMVVMQTTDSVPVRYKHVDMIYCQYFHSHIEIIKYVAGEFYIFLSVCTLWHKVDISIFQ